MKKDSKIDHIFREGLSDLTEVPPAFIWNNIESDLLQDKRNKRVILFWRSVAAACIATIVSIGTIYFYTSNNQVNIEEIAQQVKLPINDHINTNSDKSEKLISKEKNIDPIQKNTVENSPKISGHTGTQKAVESQSLNNNKNLHKSTNNLIVANTKEALPAKIASRKPSNFQKSTELDANQLFASNNNHIDINETYARYFDKLHEENNIKENKNTSFALGGQFSPAYSFRSSNENKANNEDGIVSYTGGINLHIKPQKKWAIETGIYYAQVGQKFNNPIIPPIFQGESFGSNGSSIQDRVIEPNLQNSLGTIKLENSSQQDLLAEASTSGNKYLLDSSENPTSNSFYESANYQQELNYIEVPLLLRYNLINKGLNLSVSGGVSTNFLIGNNAYKLQNNSKEYIGETSDIENINYSAVMGFGISTPIIKSLDFNFEPRIKYFLNSVSSQQEFKPYSFGLYTGISYKF